jgi:hypothetical protein
MAIIYRTMIANGDKPKVGSVANTLGVRVPFDIEVDANGLVRPGTGGMSVAPGWRELLGHLIPRRLRHLAPKATGKDVLVCWRMDELSFQAGPLAPGLQLRIDPKNDRHGVIEPDREMLLIEFQAALASTREFWLKDEG